MRRKFLSIVFYSLFATLLLSGISYGVKEPIKSGNMKDVFRDAFALAGGGDMWTETENDSVGSCSAEGDFVFITKPISIGGAFADVIWVALETSFSSVNNSSSLGIYLHNGPAQTNHLKDFFRQNFSRIYTLEDRTARNGKKWNYIFKFSKDGSNNITLAVRGIGVCSRVWSIKVYYYYCGEKYFNVVKFPKTQSPFEGRKKVEANCSVNSSPSNQGRILSGFCRYNGTWDYSRDIGCFCEQGYEQNSLMKCSPCRSNHFKPTSSNTTCKSCPKGSTNTSNGTSCKCMKGYYHSTLNANPTTATCFGPIKEKLKISVKKLRDKTFNVTWTAVQVEDEIKHTVNYDIECILCEGQKCNMTCQNVKYKPRQNNLTETFVEVSNLLPEHRYKLRVYPKTVINKFIGKENWNYTEQEEDTYSVPTTASTKPPITNSSKTKSKTKSKTTYFDYVIVSSIASGFLFMIMVVLLIIVVKSKTARINRRHLLTGNEHQVELPDIGQKLYVDPSIYDNPEEALNEFTSELDPSVLELEKLIGGGEFGNVYKGTMKCNEGKSMAVAVKTLKTDHTVKNENDFLLEASIMGQFNDLNVIHLEGVITKSFPRMIVTEYMSNGSLDRFLRLNDEGLTYLQLIGMARGVASGMVYLCAKNFIHRDLAARNILVNDDLLCKVADFGLSRFVETEGSDGEHSISGGKIPVRWTAPEVIKYRKYSFSSDVWSYGILLWEIMSFGEKPYWEWENHEVIKKVEEGFRLPAYKDCPRAVHNLMLSCWKANRGERPKFEHIRQVLNGWITSPKTIVQDSKDSGIGDWLHSIKMGEYRSTFLNADYESPYQLMGIGDKDLLKIGVRLIGHRKTILKAIKAFDDTKDEIQMTLTSTESNLLQSSQSDI